MNAAAALGLRQPRSVFQKGSTALAIQDRYQSSHQLTYMDVEHLDRQALHAGFLQGVTEQKGVSKALVHRTKPDSAQHSMVAEMGILVEALRQPSDLTAFPSGKAAFKR